MNNAVPTEETDSRHPSAVLPLVHHHRVSAPVAFALGIASACVARAAAASLEKAARPWLTRAFKHGIRVSRAARGMGEQIGAVVADSYAQARLEVEQEEAGPGATVPSTAHDHPHEHDHP